MTEPESLGPCEPGTAVKLQGIVWQETDKGKNRYFRSGAANAGPAGHFWPAETF
jgi:hypothetical protein